MRQSLRVYSASPDLSIFLQPDYDVVERVVSFRPPNGALLEPGLLYRAELFVPAEDDGAGFRAFDGAPLVRGEVPVHFSFQTARVAPPPPSPIPPPTCPDALAVFADSCADCHSGPSAFMGLELESGSSLRRTALSQVAREAEGPRAGTALVDPARFGVGMALIEPGSPPASYLVYKLLLDPANFGTGPHSCESTHVVSLPPGTCPLAPEAERARLADWFVRLDPMPPAGAGLLSGLDDLRTLTGFIRAGANTEDCE